AQVLARFALIRRLAQDAAVDDDDRVDSQHPIALDRRRLPPGMGDGDVLGRAGQLGLVVPGRDDVELDPEHRQDRAPLGRARRQPQRLSARQPLGDHPVSSESAKKMTSSRAAEPGESEPWTTLRPRSSAKSPRIVPGAESSGLVAPIIERTVATAPSPSIAIATTGPEVMNSTSSG